MEASQVELGAVFEFSHDKTPLRVILRDEDVVMYDAWWPHVNGWGLADLQMFRKQRVTYYVVTVRAIIEKASTAVTRSCVSCWDA